MRRPASRTRAAALSIVAVLAVGGCASKQPTGTASSGTASSGTASSGTASPSTPAAPLTPAEVDPKLAVTVTPPSGATPTARFTAPLKLTRTVRKVVSAGPGPAVTADETVLASYALYSGTSGKELTSNYSRAPEPFPVSQVFRGLARGLLGAKVGDRLVLGVAPAEGLGATGTQFGLSGTDTIVFVMDVRKAYVPLTKAEGTVVPPPAGLPTVQVGADGKPTGITVPKTTPPAKLVAQVLIKGAGAKVSAGQRISVQYTGVTWSDGKVFDSSWSRGAPASFAIGTGAVIKGWDVGLVGQTVGSRVLLVIPADQAYGADAAKSGKPAGTLVFVVDILDSV